MLPLLNWPSERHFPLSQGPFLELPFDFDFCLKFWKNFTTREPRGHNSLDTEDFKTILNSLSYLFSNLCYLWIEDLLYLKNWKIVFVLFVKSKMSQILDVPYVRVDCTCAHVLLISTSNPRVHWIQSNFRRKNVWNWAIFSMPKIQVLFAVNECIIRRLNVS